MLLLFLPASIISVTHGWPQLNPVYKTGERWKNKLDSSTSESRMSSCGSVGVNKCVCPSSGLVKSSTQHAEKGSAKAARVSEEQNNESQKQKVSLHRFFPRLCIYVRRKFMPPHPLPPPEKLRCGSFREGKM